MHTNEANTFFGRPIDPSSKKMEFFGKAINENKHNPEVILDEKQDFVFKVVDIIKYPELPEFKSSSVYLSPNIPSQKLMNALKAYASRVNPEDVLLIVDNTIFGNAKTGLLVTKYGEFFFKEFLSSPKTAKFSDITEFSNDRGVLVFRFENQLSWHFGILGEDNDVSLFHKYLLDLINAFKDNLEKVRKRTLEKLAEDKKEKAQYIEYKENSNHRQEELKYQQRLVQLRYFGSKTNNKAPSPSFFGESIVNNDQQNVTLDQNSNSILDKFFLDNSDGVIGKLKESGLSLTASALQNDANIAKIANFIYNLLPSPIRFVVNVSIIEDFLLKNRFWLIEKLK